MKKTFKGKIENLYVDGTDMPSVKSTINAKLKQDTTIDYVVTLGAPFALTAVQAVDEAGSKAKVATFDLNKDLTTAIKDGDVEFAVDQQPYLQGYLAVDALWLYNNNGNYSGGGEDPVLTGPAFVDKSNVDADRRSSPRRAPGERHDPATAGTGAAEPLTAGSAGPAQQTDGRTTQRSLALRLLARPEVGVFLGAVAVFVFFFIAAPPFREAGSMANVLYQSSTIGHHGAAGGAADDRRRVRPVRRRRGDHLGADRRACSATS